MDNNRPNEGEKVVIASLYNLNVFLKIGPSMSVMGAAMPTSIATNSRMIRDWSKSGSLGFDNESK